MPKKQKRDLALIAAIIFAALSVSGSLVFLGWQFTGSGNAEISQEMIQNAIREFADNSRKEQATRPAGDVIAPNEDDHIKGDEKARITLIEFSDFECPFCKRFHPIPEELIARYDGKVNWTYRHFPLKFHDPLATLQAVATECVADQAGNDAFWDYTNRIFETTNSNGKGMEITDLVSLAGEFGISESDFTACMDSGKFNQDVKDDIADGVEAGVGGTPGTVIYDNKTGTKILVEGAQPIDIFEGVIDQLLESN